jgi:hypothetical protein
MLRTWLSTVRSEMNLPRADLLVTQAVRYQPRDGRGRRLVA